MTIALVFTELVMITEIRSLKMQVRFVALLLVFVMFMEGLV